MFSAFEWVVALRYLRARRQEGFISVIAWFSLLGIALGVATLIVVMAVMNGFRHELLSRILGLNGHLTVYGSPSGIGDYASLTLDVSEVPGVVSVAPIVQGQVMVTSRGLSRGALARGILRDDLERRPMVAGNILGGSLADFDAGNGVVVGVRLAEQMGLGIGDEITLISPQGRVTVFGSIPRVGAFPIVAIFEIGMFEYDSGFVFMPLATAQTYFQLSDRVSALEVFVADPDRAPAVARSIAERIGMDWRIQDWQRANASFFNAIQVERNVMFLILTLIIVVAAFNVISSLIMLVKDKGRDIAILRTMGATRGMIMRIFFIAGASIGVVGTLTGLLAGVAFVDNIELFRRWIEGLTGTELFAAEIYFLSRLPADPDPFEVLLVVVMALTLSLLATVYPSWRAARIEPAEALRDE